MVFYFSPKGHQEGTNAWLIYMGKDKYENEDLIKYGLPEDVWFHVDKLSSAHVYLRLPRGKMLDDIPDDVLEECCQLVKQNSIQGCKENNIDIVYTKWNNLKKSADMVVGQVRGSSSARHAQASSGFQNATTLRYAQVSDCAALWKQRQVLRSHM